MKIFSAFMSGILFSIGLGISGMMNPDKVLNFLDLFGSFDLSLIFVMGGALIVSFFAFKYCGSKDNPICETEFCIPDNKKIDKKLIIGSILFGIGWGMGGICPGPALANIATGSTDVLLFILAMLVGMGFVKLTKIN